MMWQAVIERVSIPYGLTLLSNKAVESRIRYGVSIPYGLTLLSNLDLSRIQKDLVSIPYGLTLLSNRSAPVSTGGGFQSPMD